MITKFLATIASVAALVTTSCSQIRTESVSSLDVKMDVSLPDYPASKVHLAGVTSPLTSAHIWKWDAGDVLTYTYSLKGTEYAMTAATTSIDPKDSTLLRVVLEKVPAEALLTEVSYGSAEVFGTTCATGTSIPSSMVYARSAINSSPGETNIPGITLSHCCSYFLIEADNALYNDNTYAIMDVMVSGHALKGEDKDETLTVSLYDTATRTVSARWLALSNKATDIVFTASFGAGSAEMARVSSAGDGVCTLFHISNRGIGQQY